MPSLLAGGVGGGPGAGGRPEPGAPAGGCGRQDARGGAAADAHRGPAAGRYSRPVAGVGLRGVCGGEGESWPPMPRCSCLAGVHIFKAWLTNPIRAWGPLHSWPVVRQAVRRHSLACASTWLHAFKLPPPPPPSALPLVSCPGGPGRPPGRVACQPKQQQGTRAAAQQPDLAPAAGGWVRSWVCVWEGASWGYAYFWLHCCGVQYCTLALRFYFASNR